MNTYARFQRSLITGFEINAQPQVRSLWADLIELGEATDPCARRALVKQARHRVRALGRAARATNCRDVLAVSEALDRSLAAVPCAKATGDRVSFGGLSQTMNKLAEAVYGVRGSTSVFGRACQSAELALVESDAD